MDFSSVLNTIVEGDCVEQMQNLPPQSVDVIFADPPYNLQLQNELYRPDRTRVNGVEDPWDKFPDFSAYDSFTESWLRECHRVLKDSGTLWVIGSYHNIFRVGKIMLDLGFWILNDLVWRKSNPTPNFKGTRFTNATETMIWAARSADQKQYTFNYRAMKNLNDDKQMTNVWDIPLCTGAERIKLNGKKAHSTQKPEALLYRVILASSNPGDIILDPFFGSGTTGAVAKKMKRHFIGIEIDPAYVEIARARLAAIPDTDIEIPLLKTPSRQKAPRVLFGRLLEAGYLGAGQRLYSHSGDHEALIRADSFLVHHEIVGSIHQVACHIQGRDGVNGWDFWYFEDENGALLSIDRLRERYRVEILT